jgi:hypothetical protein
MKEVSILQQLQKILQKHYQLYRSGEISKEEYLIRIKPIDEAIDRQEMATLQGTPLWRELFSPHSHKPEHS